MCIYKGLRVSFQRNKTSLLQSIGQRPQLQLTAPVAGSLDPVAVALEILTFLTISPPGQT